MPRCRQGEIWWAELPAPVGRRPALVLTRSNAIPILGRVTIGPLTRSMRGIETEVLLSQDDGVPTSCAVALDNILTIGRSALDRRITTISAARLHEVFEAIRIAFAMPAFRT